jgi:hypothetical protein
MLAFVCKQIIKLALTAGAVAVSIRLVKSLEQDDASPTATERFSTLKQLYQDIKKTS